MLDCTYRVQVPYRTGQLARVMSAIAEAVRAAVAWGDVRFEPARTVCLIDPENLASIRVAQKCGYVEFERTLFNEQPTLFLARGTFHGP